MFVQITETGLRIEGGAWFIVRKIFEATYLRSASPKNSGPRIPRELRFVLLYVFSSALFDLFGTRRITPVKFF
jgi:hypothetical protein